MAVGRLRQINIPIAVIVLPCWLFSQSIQSSIINFQFSRNQMNRNRIALCEIHSDPEQCTSNTNDDQHVSDKIMQIRSPISTFVGPDLLNCRRSDPCFRTLWLPMAHCATPGITFKKLGCLLVVSTLPPLQHPCPFLPVTGHPTSTSYPLARVCPSQLSSPTLI